MDGTTDGLGSSRRSGGWDQEEVEGAVGGTNDGLGISRRSDGSKSSRWIYKDYYLY